MSELVSIGNMNGSLEGIQNINAKLDDQVHLQAKLRTVPLGGQLFWFGTRSEYNSLTYRDPTVCYCIEEGT